MCLVRVLCEPCTGLEFAISLQALATSPVKGRGRVPGPAYLRRLARLWAHPSVASLTIRVNPRLTRSAGRWIPSARAIELSPAVLRRSVRSQREVICHEAAHAVCQARFGPTRMPHGPRWAALVAAAGFEPNATLVRCGKASRRRKPHRHFRHFCPVCHFQRVSSRKVAAWHCPECRAVGLAGTLRIEQLIAGR
jgi:predicted SprT family Zn-dependent metalloprotease